MSDVQAAIAKAEFPAKAQVLFQPENSRYRVMYGGRGGAKSWAAARALLIKGAKTPLRILCAREYQTSIKDSVHKLLCDQIIDLELTSFYETTQAAIRGRNGTEFAFVGLKNNVANVKSFEGIDICWVEEAQTVSRNSWNVLIPTIRKEGSEIWITFNPELETDETYQRFVVKPPANAVVQKINWSDNPWFPETLRIEKESLRERDIQAYNQVWEGMCRQTVDGAIFATEMQRAEADGRITRVPYDPIKPVHAVWDLGWSDQTAIWFLQFVGMETRLISYLEDSQKTVNHYLQELQKKGYVYDTLWLPHDAENKTLAGNGRTIEELVKTAGYKTQILPKVPVVDSINAARTLFPNMWFDRENCADGLTCLRHYRYDVDPNTGMFSRNPRHDQYSHGADAFRYIALMLRDKPKPRPKREVAMAGSWMS